MPELVLRKLNSPQLGPLFLTGPPPAGSAGGGLLVLAAEDERGELAGLVVAAAKPRLVRVLVLDGDPEACRLLLGRLVRQAGKRDVGGWFPTRRRDLHGVLEDLSFRRVRGGRSSVLYRLRRGGP
jgi:hypothetical protein